jgi:hypothetical protein
MCRVGLAHGPLPIFADSCVYKYIILSLSDLLTPQLVVDNTSVFLTWTVTFIQS